MSSFWTVTPSVKRFDLEFEEHAFSINLKTELSHGEAKLIAAAGIRSWSKKDGAQQSETNDGMEINVNLDQAAMTKVLTWMAGWSLSDDAGASLPINVDTLRALRGGVGKLIEETIDAHAKTVTEGEAKPGAVEKAAPLTSGPEKNS